MGYSGPNLSNLSNIVEHTYIVYKSASTYYAFETASGTVKYTNASFTSLMTSVIGAMTAGSIFIKNPGSSITVGATMTITDKSIHIYGDNTILDFSAYNNIIFRFTTTGAKGVLDCGLHDFILIGTYTNTSEIFSKFENVIATVSNCSTTGSNKIYNLVYLMGNCTGSKIWDCKGAPRNFVIAAQDGSDQSDYVDVSLNNLDQLYDGAGNYTTFVGVTYGNHWRITSNCCRGVIYFIAATYMKYATITGNTMTGGVTTISLGVSCDFCTLTGNVIMNGYNNFKAFYIDSAYGTTIQGNIVYSATNNGFRGIELNTVRRVTITGNEIYIAGSPTTNYGIYDAGTSQEVVIMNNIITSENAITATGIYIATSLTDGLIAFNEIRNFSTAISVAGTSNGRVFRNIGYVTHAEGATSVADGGTISHGLVSTPTGVVCTPSVASEMVSVTARAASTFTVAIKKHDNTAGTTQTVYWHAWYTI